MTEARRMIRDAIAAMTASEIGTSSKKKHAK
jgi:hypothetical protein